LKLGAIDTNADENDTEGNGNVGVVAAGGSDALDLAAADLCGEARVRRGCFSLTRVLPCRCIASALLALTWHGGCIWEEGCELSGCETCVLEAEASFQTLAFGTSAGASKAEGHKWAFVSTPCLAGVCIGEVILGTPALVVVVVEFARVRCAP